MPHERMPGDGGMTSVHSQPTAPFACPSENGDPRVADVRMRLNVAHAASATPPPKAAAKLVSQNKLYVRERIALLLCERAQCGG